MPGLAGLFFLWFLTSQGSSGCPKGSGVRLSHLHKRQGRDEMWQAEGKGRAYTGGQVASCAPLLLITSGQGVLQNILLPKTRWLPKCPTQIRTLFCRPPGKKVF